MKPAVRTVSIALAIFLAGSGTLLAAEKSIDDLLRCYRMESDLSKRTKQENAGYVVVYTRDDLERMQIMRLSEILKLNRFLPYSINSYGMSDPNHLDPFFYNSDVIKVYVNDHEITTAFSGSGLQFYGDVDMGMFDHVEIYYNAPILDVATEPSMIVVKLYTKSPERENGGNFTLRTGIRKSQEAVISHGQGLEEWSYFAYAEESEDNFEHWKNDRLPPQYGTFDLSRDKSRQHLYLDLQKKDQRLEMEYYRIKSDPFTGQTVNLTPTGGYWEQPVERISYSGKWLDGKLRTNLSYIHSSLDFDITSSGLFWGQIVLPSTPAGSGQYFKMKTVGNMVTAKASYEEEWFENHLLKFGGIYRYKEAEIEKYFFNDVSLSGKKANMHVGTIYLQDQAELREDTVFALSAKVDRFSIHKNRSLLERDETLVTWQGRASVTTIQGPWHFKAFANHVEFPTELYMFVLLDEPLDSQKSDSFSFEMEHKGPRDRTSLYIAHNWNRDTFIPSPTAVSNSKKFDYRTLIASVDEVYRFDEFNRIEFNLNIIWMLDFPDSDTKKRTSGGYVRLLNTLGDFDIYNEVAYRENTNSTPRALGYNAGIRWHPQRDLTLAIKGVDILNRDVEQSLLLPAIPEREVSVPIVGRQVYFTLEWLF